MQATTGLNTHCLNDQTICLWKVGIIAWTWQNNFFIYIDNLPRNAGNGILPLLVSKPNLSAVTGVFIGASFSFQSGISSLRAIGSTQAPDKMCPPISAAFSSRVTLTSWEQD